MFEVAGGIFIAVIALFIVLPISTMILGLILSHGLNAITPNDIISDKIKGLTTIFRSDSHFYFLFVKSVPFS